MKAATTAAKNIILKDHDVRAVPKLLAEWEHNRFSPIKEITVTPAQADDDEWNSIYDIDSVGLPNRPRNGIAKARFDANGKLKAGTKYRDTPQSTRFYLAGDDDPYKYFSSTSLSQTTTGAEGGYYFAAPVQLSLIYENVVLANKIVVGFETSYSKPKTFTIEVTFDGAAWYTVASNPAIDVRGQVTLWRDDRNRWLDVPDYNDAIFIKGIRVSVYSMADASSHLDVIQMGARLENDLSEFVEDYDRGFEISDHSLIAPLGKASANTATVGLSNIDRRFNDDNIASPYYGLIGKKVKFTMDLSIDARPAGSADERVREFTMWSDSWGGQDEATASVQLKDSSGFLQDIPMPKVFWQDLTVGAIVWQTMDILGFSNYNYTTHALDTGQLVPFFWPEDDTTAWEELSTLAEGTQTAIYFDEYDVMQIKTRKALFSADNDVVWNFDAVQNGQKLPDIVSIETDDNLVVNKVDINYKPAKYSDFNNGLPKMETVWEPEDDSVVLRATPLAKDLALTATEMWIGSADAALWPYNSIVNIRGELLRYDGKEYVSRKPGGVVAYNYVYNQEDKERLDAASDPNLLWANKFSGRLKIVERGVGGTAKAGHHIKPNSYSSLITNYPNTKLYPIGVGQGMNYFDGAVTLSPPASVDLKKFLINEYFLVKHEAVIESKNTTYGGRIRFPNAQLKGNRWACGGIFFAGGSLDSGYYLEVLTTETVDDIDKRANRHELALIVMPGNAPAFPAVSTYENSTKGAVAGIITGQWYDIDIRHTVQANGDAQIVVFLDGVRAGVWNVPASKRPVSEGKFGMFIRHQCKMDVEYLYAVYQNAPVIDEPDQSTFLDLVRGGFTSGYIERQWRYGSRYTTTKRGPAKQGGYFFNAHNSKANYVLDEFGPVVHELREFEVNFDEDAVPVTHSYLYLSNTRVVCTNYWADSFKAVFTLANASRRNAVISGEDTSLGESQSVDHKMFVFGRALYQEDDLTVTVEDTPSIRRNGAINLTFDNRFIQTETIAEELGKWVVEQWSRGCDEISMEVFGNPFIQLGDLVTINFPVKDMFPASHKYYVVSISNKFAKGLETNLILRRARI